MTFVPGISETSFTRTVSRPAPAQTSLSPADVAANAAIPFRDWLYSRICALRCAVADRDINAGTVPPMPEAIPARTAPSDSLGTGIEFALSMLR